MSCHVTSRAGQKVGLDKVENLKLKGEEDEEEAQEEDGKKNV
jgi:hypothetical protein